MIEGHVTLKSEISIASLGRDAKAGRTISEGGGEDYLYFLEHLIITVRF